MKAHRVVAALWALGASAAGAVEDGGVSSVFTEGAGSRAISLGGAFCAVSDDASAPLWNPAGLGMLERYELQAMSVNLYGLNISEQYGALALPSWRWGTAAVVFRRFGVDGIEHRDDRNVLLADDLSDSQVQVQLSYGRRMSEAWSAGGSLKLQRQSLAGFSAMGLGMDLGVMARPGLVLGGQDGWADRFTLGLTLQNAVEPSLRLDQESVPDPATLRAGFAWRQPYRIAGLGPGYALASFDIVQTRRSRARGHAGLEVAPHPLLALRAGFSDGSFSAGTGVRWRLYSLDYAMQDNPLETVHRVGLTMQFGATTGERRLASQRRQEEKLRERLAASFEEREAERVREMLAAARAMLDRGDVDEALAALATVTALDPDNPDVRALEVRALLRNASREEAGGEYASAAVLYGRVLAVAPENLAAQSGLARCRQEGDRRAERTARIRELFAEALDAFTAGELVAARSGFARILELAPEDEEARDMLARTESATTARAADLIEQADRFLARGLLEEAEELVARARALDSRAQGLSGLVMRLKVAQNEALRGGPQVAAVTEGPPGRPAVKRRGALSQKKRKEIADLYERGRAAMEEERADDALRYWELVWLADPDYLSVSDYLKREYLLRGLESFSHGRLEEAVGQWEKALKVDPSDEKTLGYLKRAREQQSRTREILGTDGAR